MNFSLIYWILMLIVLVLGLLPVWITTNTARMHQGFNLILYLLLILLGWQVFGAPAQTP